MNLADIQNVQSAEAEPPHQAMHLRGSTYAVRPMGCAGTCGWVNGRAWTVIYVSARNATEAVQKALWQGGCFH